MEKDKEKINFSDVFWRVVLGVLLIATITMAFLRQHERSMLESRKFFGDAGMVLPSSSMTWNVDGQKLVFKKNSQTGKSGLALVGPSKDPICESIPKDRIFHMGELSVSETERFVLKPEPLE